MTRGRRPPRRRRREGEGARGEAEAADDGRVARQDRRASGELAKLKPGMTKEDAKKASPLADKAGTQESEIDGVAYAVAGRDGGIES